MRKVEQLRQEKLTYAVRIKELQALKEENEQLRKALEFKKERSAALVGVEILAFDPSSLRRIVTINRGSNDGVRKGFYAIDEEGWLVGKVVEVRPTYAWVMLVDDPDFSIPVFVGKASVGLLKGSLGGTKILYIENGEFVRENDRVWLKVPFLKFPIYVGEVQRLKEDKGSIFCDVEVRLFSENPLLHQMFIVQ